MGFKANRRFQNFCIPRAAEGAPKSTMLWGPSYFDAGPLVQEPTEKEGVGLPRFRFGMILDGSWVPIEPQLEEQQGSIWMVVKMMVPFWVLNITRHLVFRGPKKGP